MATAVPALDQATYGRYGLVTILCAEGSLSKIQTASFDEFWVKTDKLKMLKRPKVAPVPASAMQAETAPDVAPAHLEGVDDESIQTFVKYLQRSTYTLYVSCTPAAVEYAESEYLTWTGGEPLPEGCIRVYEKAYFREWFLLFPYTPDVVCPFPIIERGTGGGKGKPCGLHKNGRIEMCYAQITEVLVRAGLRASKNEN